MKCCLSGRVVVADQGDCVEAMVEDHAIVSPAVEKCFLVVTTEALFNSSPTWELQILKLGKGEAQPEVVDMRTILVRLQQEEKVLQWLLFPDVQRSDLAWEEMEPAFCQRHNLICICETGISVYKIDLTMPELKLIQKARQVEIPTCRCHILNPETRLSCVTSAQALSRQPPAGFDGETLSFLCVEYTDLGTANINTPLVGAYYRWCVQSHCCWSYLLSGRNLWLFTWW